MVLPHVAEQDVRLYAFRDKIGGLDRVLHHGRAGLIRQPEVVACIKNADHIICRLAAYRITGVAAAGNAVFPLLHVFFQP